jgi:transposase-like protein
VPGLENGGMQAMTATSMIPELRAVLKRLHYPLEVMLVCTRWYVGYSLSFRHFEEMMQELGNFVDHSTVHRWCFENPARHGSDLSSP